LRRSGRLVGVRRPAETPPVLRPPARPVCLVGPVGTHLAPELLFKAPLGLLETLRAAARHRLRARRALGLQALLGLTQPPAATLRGRELRRQLVAARLPVELVLGRVSCLGLLDDLARQLLVIEVLVARRVRQHLRAVDGDHADLGQPAARAQRQHLAEQTTGLGVGPDQRRAPARETIAVAVRWSESSRELSVSISVVTPTYATASREAISPGWAEA
jgi:hypothetical protein